MSFRQATAKSEAQWEALLRDLYERGLEGKQVHLVTTDGCPRTSPGIGHGISIHVAAEVPGTQAEACSIKTKTYEPGRVSGAGKEDIPGR